MKQLYLIRHAEACQQHLGISDKERKLTEHGIEDAQQIGEQLYEAAVKPDLLLVSPAQRTITTAQILARELGLNKRKIITEEIIYSGDVEQLIELIQYSDPRANTIILVGHNPTISMFCHILCDGTLFSLPTCGVIGIRFSIQHWEEIANIKGELITYLHPQHEFA